MAKQTKLYLEDGLKSNGYKTIITFPVKDVCMLFFVKKYCN